MRVWLFACVVCAATVFIAGAYYQQQNETYGELEAATTRLATAVARGDQQALASDPLLQDRPETVARLRQYEAVLASGYRVRVSRNGFSRHELPSDEVTHLGVIETSLGTLLLGFRYDPKTAQLGFVTAEFSITG